MTIFKRRNEQTIVHSLIAFTLAEVLITLGIIGVVASLTVPILINNINDAQTKSGVKEAYSILSQAMTNAYRENGNTITGLASNHSTFKDIFKPYLSYIKDCSSNAITDGCWITQNYKDATPWVAVETSQNAGLILKNGMLLYFRLHSSNCLYTDGNSINWRCGFIEVDINGFKGPNRTGMDTFPFSLQDGSVKPFGISGDNNNFGSCKSTDIGNSSGWGCTYKYLQ